MNTFSLAFFIATGLFVLAVWVLLILDVVGPGLGRIVARIVGRTRDRKIRRAAGKWAVLHPGYIETADDLPAAARRIHTRTLPRTDKP